MPQNSGFPMVVFRCTKRIARRFRLTVADEVHASTGILGDWYANLISVGSSRWVLCMSERSLLPVFVPARNESFPAQFAPTLGQVLQRLRIPDHLTAKEIDAAAEIAFARTRNRRALGVLKEFGFLASDYLGSIYDLDAAVAASLRLAETPSTVIGNSPDRITAALFEDSGATHPQ